MPPRRCGPFGAIRIADAQRLRALRQLTASSMTASRKSRDVNTKALRKPRESVSHFCQRVSIAPAHFVQ
jgi:hypothetical protein